MSWQLSRFFFFLCALWNWRSWRDLTRARRILKEGQRISASFAFVGGRSTLEAPYMAKCVLRNGHIEALDYFGLPPKGIYPAIMSAVMGAALTARYDILVVLVRPSTWARCLWGNREEMIRAEQGLSVFGFERKVVIVPVKNSHILDTLEAKLTKAVREAYAKREEGDEP